MSARTRRIAATAVALVVVVTPAAFSKPAAAPTTILIRADFGVGYEVDWTAEENVDAPCSIWRKWHGHNEVNAKSGRPAPSKIFTVPGLVTNFQSLPERARAKLPPLRWGMADLAAVGWAHGTVQRTVTETGGINWTGACGDTRPTYSPTPNDCGGEHRFTVRNATLRADRRILDGTLTGLREDPGLGNGRKVIEFTIQPPLPPYRKCEMLPDSVAPEFPTRLPLFVPLNALRLLAGLKKRGDVVRFDSQSDARYHGDCVDKKLLPNPLIRCTFALDLNVRIRRTN